LEKKVHLKFVNFNQISVELVFFFQWDLVLFLGLVVTKEFTILMARTGKELKPNPSSTEKMVRVNFSELPKFCSTSEFLRQTIRTCFENCLVNSLG